MKSYLLKLLIFVVLGSFLSPLGASGQITITNPLEAESLEDLIDGVINFIFWVATALAPLMIVIGGFYFLTAAGNPQQIDTAKKIILYTLVGYGIILLSKGLILVIKDILGGGG